MYYGKENLKSLTENPEAQEIYRQGQRLEKRAWNRYVSGRIIDEFLEEMDRLKQDALEFMNYHAALVWAEAGMFYTAAEYLKLKVIPELKSESLIEAARKFATALEEADDVPADTEAEEIQEAAS